MNEWENAAVTAYWLAHYVGTNPDVCRLCGNSGLIDTRLTRSPRGEVASPNGVEYCLCPNGQTLRHFAGMVRP